MTELDFYEQDHEEREYRALCEWLDGESFEALLVADEPEPEAVVVVDNTPWGGWLRSASGVMVKPNWYQEGE